VTYKR